MFKPVLRMNGGVPFVTYNQNYIVDFYMGQGFGIWDTVKELGSITGVLENNLFLNTCDRIIVGGNGTFEIVENTRRSQVNR